MPCRTTGFTYVITAIGTSVAASRIVARTSVSLVPPRSASADASWITPPSITGSENGIPTSIASAPADCEPPEQTGVHARIPPGHVRHERAPARVASGAQRRFEPPHSGHPEARPHRVEVLVPSPRQADEDR